MVSTREAEAIFLSKDPLPYPLPEGRGSYGDTLPFQGEDSTSFPLPLQGEGQGGGQTTRYHRGGVNRHNTKATKYHAKRLRQSLTEAEKTLWYYLRAKRFADYKFRRQHPIGSYIVDFVCLKQTLVIELDGGQHATSKKDAVRTAHLNTQGFTVLRFWNNEVLENAEGVLSTILQQLLKTPSLSLPLKVEGTSCTPSPFRERVGERVINPAFRINKEEPDGNPD